MVDNVTHLNTTRATGDVVKHPRTLMLEDLEKSGLTPSDIGARLIDAPERAATKSGAQSQGYVIPYYDIMGNAIPHYRIKLFTDEEAKYRQPHDTGTYIYFPKQFLKTAKQAISRGHRTIFLTEGEKKAAAAVKMGFPTVAVGGVDAWRNRIVTIPGDNLTPGGKEGKVKAKLDADEQISEDNMSNMAMGMQDVLDFVTSYDCHIIIVYDSDRVTGIRPQVQRAAASLGFELRFRGIPFQQIRQIILPFHDDLPHHLSAQRSLGLDDFLVADGGYDHFIALTKICLKRRSAFPRHPNPADYIGKKLQRSKISRKDQQAIAIAMLSELDSTGMRLKNKEEHQTYYFDLTTHTLMRAGFLFKNVDEGHETQFGSLLYNRFGISGADQRSLTWLSAQFNSEAPIGEVTPERVIASPRKQDPTDTLRLQISDGQYVAVTADEVSVCSNGRDGVLFEGGHVEPITGEDIIREYRRLQRLPLTNWWNEVFAKVRLKDHHHTQFLHSLLYYVSPWLYRWRGTQLPVELVLGESGSGKSTLSELRLAILTGKPRLRGTPTDIRDWHASIVNSGGLHVTDNVQLADYSLRQKLSDELCRLVTEPLPYIESRRLYTNADIVRFPVRSVFGLTAISQPFQNADILQRSVILELEKPMESVETIFEYEGNFVHNRIQERGGRAAWLAHHILVLQRFFQITQKSWNHNYKAKHRLINFEQALVMMSKVFNWDTSWLPDYLMGVTDVSIAHADWVFEGVQEYCNERKQMYPNWAQNADDSSMHFFTQDICDWAISQREYQKCEVLVNSRKLAKWMQQNTSLIGRILGVIRTGKFGNRVRYKLVKVVEKKPPTTPTATTTTENVEHAG